MSLPDARDAQLPPRTGPAPRIGYVLKMYPRFSETFILSEMLALEAQGADLEIFSLRPPADGRFHDALARVRAPVTYLPHHLRTTELWRVLAQASTAVPDLCWHLDDLLEVSPDEAAAAVEIAVAVRRSGITHLHAHFGSVAATVARLAARISGTGYSFTAHAKDIFHDDVDQADLRRKLADARFVVTVSDYNLRYLRDRFGTAADRVVRVYNGLDLDAFGYRPRQDPPPTVTAVGRLVEKKGFVHLIDAMALLAGRGRRARLEIVGAGPQEEELRRRVDGHGLAASVTFHGPLPQRQMAEVLARSAVFAAPCVIGADGNRDGLPTVVLEALALGTPCVATPVTGMAEAVKHEQTGLLVPEADPVALAAAIEQLLTDRATARRLSDAGRELVESTFDIRRNATRLHRLLTEAARDAHAAIDSPTTVAEAADPVPGTAEVAR
ncbi:glycosyltransferase family 4 protein [Ruania suaedae]|uniref:glycosyltransferase family 4 protein n=1 Tax=Ruania suaedae TaxID=2897774 RepID=UPI001E3AF0D0|nr:glycosyltransferase family 4 protein [Ruania suaedae]UFU03788.1 glycosyltransferase family 4 protein [Ruania suaedae]